MQGPAGGSGRLLGATALVLVVGVGAYVLLMPPDQNQGGADTSQPADMQAPEQTPGVDTRMLVQPDKLGLEVEAQPAVAMRAPTPAIENDTSAADRARIADLERQIEALRNAKRDPVDVQALIREERAALQEQFKREREAAEQRYQLQLTELTRTLSTGDPGMSEGEREARQQLEQERQRRAAIADAQIMSDGIVLDASGAKTGGGAAGGSAAGDGSTRELSSNESFVEQASTQSYDTVRATQIAAPGRTIVQGTTLNAVLETAVSTELPGVIRAVVTDDVMSYDGINVLLAKGSRLIGSYNSDVSVVQDRVQIAWSRAVTPEGVSVELGGYGADGLGRSGQAGHVDARFRQRFGSAALISLIGAGPEIMISRDSGKIQSDTATDIGNDLSTTTRGVMGDYLSAGPVIYIDQGTDMTVFVNRDLVF